MVERHEIYMIKGCSAMSEIGHGSNLPRTIQDLKSLSLILFANQLRSTGLVEQLMFNNVRTPRKNLLNFVADVSPNGKYLSSIKDPDQIGLIISIRYSLSRRALSLAPNEPEVLLLDYPSHQRRRLPLLAKTGQSSGIKF